MENPPDPFAHIGDPHWGRGGRYVVNSDGQRVPAIPEDAVATVEHESAGTGHLMTPVAGDTLTSPAEQEN